ncbi:MAG: Prolipoprotein diacylglyceryl transferase [Bacteroidetes bacterium MED-G17]|nr:MAG: Prolipoprotein diacylglyceryl transferase [Bacteroidetes bacterium MED-G17]
MGCHTSGDGDWGIVNTQDKPDWLSWLPDNLWSYNYPNNVLKKCNPYQGEEYFQHICDFSETPYLIAPVYPTALYEVLMAIGIFAFLWFIRKKINTAGIIFFIYLFFNGLERFLIEKIRVNSTYDLLGMKITQAEIISFGLMLTALGGVLSLMLRRSKKSST